MKKYDVPGPRYTSYPTAPYWDRSPTEAEWLERLAQAFARHPGGAAIYVHIPFCRSLCTYCGCHTRITRSHAVVSPYVQSLLDEYALYRDRLGMPAPLLDELHLGGGTPTFLTPEELAPLLDGLLGHSTLTPSARLSIEVDPRVTTREHLQLLASRGFRRISLGVQDFDPAVQAIVNRRQSEEQVREITDGARELGFTSVNHDLIYGLPFQTLSSIEQTMDAVCRLRPDRIALYAYAHVPWIKPGQRRFTELDLPTGDAKRALYEHSRARLEAAGYREIGLDHFALESDCLWQAARAGELHRNFMGYTEAYTLPLFGLGCSAIGDAGDAFAQNHKALNEWEGAIANGHLPLARGHLLNGEDQVLRQHILELMTRLETHWPHGATGWLAEVPKRLRELADDGLVELAPGAVRVTETGRAHLRNVCMAFDARLARKHPDQALFSQTL